jgi:hypothetical protein
MCVQSQLSIRRLWSFADMIELRAAHLVQAFTQLSIIVEGLYQYPDLRAEMLPHAKQQIASSSVWVNLEWSGFEITDTDLNFRIWALRNQLNGNNPCCPETLINQLEGIHNQLKVAISFHKFAYIPPRVQGYFEQENLFGESVFASFPEARRDIKEAGNCLASELYTAAVFHLMRTAEFGLRSLARKTRVSVKHKGKPQPVDTATWEKVIAAIKSKLAASHTMRFGATRSEKIKLYSDLADRCSFIKDLWRNDVMHTRVSYEYHDAMGAFERVKGFMQLLCNL